MEDEEGAEGKLSVRLDKVARVDAQDLLGAAAEDQGRSHHLQHETFS